MKVDPAAALVGDLAVPGVKGICQRGVLLGAVADGESELRGFGHAADTDAAIGVARALGAEVTPHVFVLDDEHRLVYRGAPDGDHRDEARDAEWLRAALDATLAGRAPAEAETRARGCSVKWSA